jgi:hypothetical protein
LLKDELRNFLVVRDRPGSKSHFCLRKIQQRIILWKSLTTNSGILLLVEKKAVPTIVIMAAPRD